MFNDQDNELDKNKLVILDSVTVNRDPWSVNELSPKNILIMIQKKYYFKFSQPMEFYLKLFNSNDTNKPNKFDKIQTRDTARI